MKEAACLPELLATAIVALEVGIGPLRRQSSRSSVAQALAVGKWRLGGVGARGRGLEFVLRREIRVVTRTDGSNRENGVRKYREYRNTVCGVLRSRLQRC